MINLIHLKMKNGDITNKKASVNIMKIKVTVYNNKNSLIVRLENVNKNNITKLVQECINCFNMYYGEFKFVDVEMV